MEESLPSLFCNKLWLWNKYFSGRIAFGLDDVNTAAIQMDGPVISAQTSDEASANIKDIRMETARSENIYLLTMYGNVK